MSNENRRRGPRGPIGGMRGNGEKQRILKEL